MISNEVSPRVHRGLAVIVALGLSALSLPAVAATQSGDESAARAAKAEAPVVVADNQGLKGNRTWSPNSYSNSNKNWNKNWNGNWNKNWNGNWNNNAYWNKKYPNKNWNKNKVYVRTWKHRPYYGQFFGGVVLGSILTAAAVGIAPPPPNPGLCWYWSDPYGYRGYWDYCSPYPPY
jgi:hypothetical protein